MAEKRLTELIDSKDWEKLCDAKHAAKILADKTVLENEIWHLFEVESPVFLADWYGWTPALIAASQSGTIDRQRLLQSSARATWTLDFHEALKPTLDERLSLVADYLAMLSRGSGVVGHGLDALQELAKGKRLSAADFLAACPAVFFLSTKAQPLRVIKMIKLLMKEDTSCLGAAARTLTAALGHTSADVQEAAIALLETLTADFTPEIQDEIRSRAEQVAASLRPRFDALIPPDAANTPAHRETAAPATTGVTDLQARIAVLSPSLRIAGGIDAALASIAAQSEPLPTPIDPRHVPRRGSAEPVVPLASLDELIEAVTVFVEKVEDAIEIERILDGINHFYSDRPVDFDKRTAPLRKRIDERSEPLSGTVIDRLVGTGVPQLIRKWLGMPAVEQQHTPWQNESGSFFRLRLQSMDFQRFTQRTNDVPLLSLPTQSDGWLDPVVLVERLKIQDRARVHVPNSIDLAQALLRLTPDGRAEALGNMTGISLHGMEIVRFALGEGKKLPVQQGYGHQQLVLAAAHARSLIDDLAGLDLSGVIVPQVRLCDDGSVHFAGPVSDDLALPEDLLTRVFSWNVQMPQYNWFGKSGDGSWGHMGRDDSLMVGWQNLAWPGDRRAMCLLGSLACNSSPEFLKNLLDRDMTWHDEHARLAAWAMGSDVPVVKGLITDALIDALGQRTLEPSLLGKHLAAIMVNLKLNRVAAVLGETARVSPLHQWGVFRIVDAVLGRLTQTPGDLHHLLTVMLEAGTLTGPTLSEPAQAKLISIPGGSKTSKLAKQLLRLELSPNKMNAVRTAALAASLDRAERWTALGFT